MQSAPIGSKIELKVPADQSMMLVIRLTTSGIAARSGMTMGNLDDLKIAVEEASSYLLYGRVRPHTVVVTYEMEENAVSVTMTGEGRSSEEPLSRDETEEEVIQAILSALVDEAEVTDGENRNVRLRKKCR